MGSGVSRPDFTLPGTLIDKDFDEGECDVSGATIEATAIDGRRANTAVVKHLFRNGVIVRWSSVFLGPHFFTSL
jgi:hypothetical protein